MLTPRASLAQYLPEWAETPVLTGGTADRPELVALALDVKVSLIPPCIFH